ncbi:MAG: NADH pyrophosphatase [Claussenomyces sp. TS43310]|nr:MAG: NADH pyrophosphatase [Claussenomyces sp. TS43310]
MGAEHPALPAAAHHDVDSMLSRKFGKEVANYFSGSPLNRVSFLRSDHDFISAALTHPSTSFLLCNNLAPVAKDPAHLAYASHAEIKTLIGENPFEKTEKQMIEEFRSDVTLPLVLFLGLDEARRNGFEHKQYKGTPYFAVDITPKGSVQKAAEGVIEAVKAKGHTFLEGRAAMTLNAPEAAIYAQARALLDWNARNPFCAGCGQPTLSINAGTKRVCPPTDMAGLATAQGSDVAAKPTERPSCATRKGISNLCFPRTDPTVIMAVVSHDGKRVLLGRNKRFPPLFYSALAGFCEPAESVEEAVRREVWEESGISLGRVVIHSTQPWPYPANLMIGAIGQALPDGEKIHLEHDPELEDAKWYDMDEVREALVIGTSGLDAPPQEGYKEGGLRLPPPTAIANQLLQAVVDGFLGEIPKI